MDLSKIIPLTLLLMLPSCHSSGVFPSKVDNYCMMGWSEFKGKDFLVGSVSALIDLKDAQGKIEETAYIYIDCRGATQLDVKGLAHVVGTDCVGVRMTGLYEDSLNPGKIIPIRPSQIEIQPKSAEGLIELIWNTDMRFTIIPHKSFSWTMNSQMSGNHYQGSTACE